MSKIMKITLAAGAAGGAYYIGRLLYNKSKYGDTEISIRNRTITEVGHLPVTPGQLANIYEMISLMPEFEHITPQNFFNTYDGKTLREVFELFGRPHGLTEQQFTTVASHSSQLENSGC